MTESPYEALPSVELTKEQEQDIQREVEVFLKDMEKRYKRQTGFRPSCNCDCHRFY